VNYDCDVACTNLFETLGRCLCRNAVPDGGAPLTSLHVLALEGVLAILSGLAAGSSATMPARASGTADGTAAKDSIVAPDALLDGNTAVELQPELLRLSQLRAAEVLRQRKQLKRRLALAAQRFNSDTKHWIEYAQELGLLPTPADAPSVARFLRDCPGLDRTMIGAFISEPDDAKHAFNTCV
jgi:golgi-specific brefeldin A-resistance guanine nucleotide exchange factor 1